MSTLRRLATGCVVALLLVGLGLPRWSFFAWHYTGTAHVRLEPSDARGVDHYRHEYAVSHGLWTTTTREADEFMDTRDVKTARANGDRWGYRGAVFAAAVAACAGFAPDDGFGVAFTRARAAAPLALTAAALVGFVVASYVDAYRESAAGYGLWSPDASGGAALAVLCAALAAYVGRVPDPAAAGYARTRAAAQLAAGAWAVYVVHQWRLNSRFDRDAPDGHGDWRVDVDCACAAGCKVAGAGGLLCLLVALVDGLSLERRNYAAFLADPPRKGDVLPKAGAMA